MNIKIIIDTKNSHKNWRKESFKGYYMQVGKNQTNEELASIIKNTIHKIGKEEKIIFYAEEEQSKQKILNAVKSLGLEKITLLDKKAL